MWTMSDQFCCFCFESLIDQMISKRFQVCEKLLKISVSSMRWLNATMAYQKYFIVSCLLKAFNWIFKILQIFWIISSNKLFIFWISKATHVVAKFSKRFPRPARKFPEYLLPVGRWIFARYSINTANLKSFLWQERHTSNAKRVA